MKFICGLLLGLICAFVVHVHAQIMFINYEADLADAKDEAKTANETRDNLLSNGRFIRVYDPKRNLNYYTFKPFVTDWSYGQKPKFVAAKQ